MLYGLHASLLLVETIADMQQLSYYRKRGKEAHRGNPRVQLGFNTYGLWKHSRHPNYVCEIGQWIVVYLYLLVAGASIHPSGLGAVLLTLLFVGSTIMAENITTAKYPAYKDWKKATPPWIPFLDWPFRRRHREAFSQQYHLADF